MVCCQFRETHFRFQQKSSVFGISARIGRVIKSTQVIDKFKYEKLADSTKIYISDFDTFDQGTLFEFRINSIRSNRYFCLFSEVKTMSSDQM